MTTIKKTTFNKKSILFFICFIFIGFKADANDYSDFLFYKNKGDTANALRVLYSLSETMNPEDEYYYNVLDNIITFETDVVKMKETTEKKIPLVSDRSRRSLLMGRSALIMLLTGMIDKAEYYYETAYTINPSENNLEYLINAAALNLETGNIEKSLQLSEFVKNNSSNAEKMEKAELIVSYVNILKNDTKATETKLNNMLDGKIKNEGVLFSIYKLSVWYKIKSIEIKSSKIIEENYGTGDLNEIKKYEIPVNPLVFLNSIMTLEDSSSSAAKTKYNAYIQTGVFSSMENASKLLSRINKTGLPGLIRENIKDGTKTYKVIIPVRSEEESQNFSLILKENSIESFMIYE